MKIANNTKIFKSGVAQGKRVGPITQRSEDRNLLSQNAVTNYYCKQYKIKTIFSYSNPNFLYYKQKTKHENSK